MAAFQDLLALWPRDRIKSHLEKTTAGDVCASLIRAASQDLDAEGFLTLLAPAAADALEDMAQTSHALTRRNFGQAVHIFTPWYISDVCENQCRYCGFNARNRQKRRHLQVDEAKAEAFAIADAGFQHVLLLTGDARRLSSPEYISQVAQAIKPRFASVGIEVYALSEAEYALLISAGVDSMTMFQETYNPDLYSWLHPAGPKRDYSWRLNAPARAADAGIRSIGIGALLGLDEFAYDAFATGLHAWWR